MVDKKRLVYISTIEEGPYQGVRAKIAMQCKAFEENGFDVKQINSGERTIWGQIGKLLPFSYGINYRIIKEKLLNEKKECIDYCYVRYSPASRGLVDVLKTLRLLHEKVKIIVEIPTYPYDDELKGIKNLPFKIRERMYRRKMKQYVDLIVTPSHLDEKRIFDIPAYEITNGIDVSGINVREHSLKEGNTINVLGIALITSKQGFDRILLGIKEYYECKNEDEPDINFFVVGDGSAKEELVGLCEAYQINDRVIFTGQKEKDELEYFYNLSDIGVGTLGLYKANELQKVNSLKTREYCAKGLPFIITECDYIFADRHFEFCQVIPNNDTPVDIRKMVFFLNDLKEKYTESEITERMNAFAQENLSWRKILSSVIAVADSVSFASNGKML